MKKPYSETKEERNQRAHDEREGKRAIFASIEDAETLRDFAVRMKLYTTRGPGAGQIGSMEALVARVAHAARIDPAQLEAILDNAPAPSGSGSDVPD